jgi:hypothetical protein
VTEQELDLLQLTTGSLAQLRACAAKVVRRQFYYANFIRIFLYYMLNRLFYNAIAPDAAHLSYSMENPTPVDSSQLLNAFDSANAGRKIRVEKTGVGCLIRQSAHHPKPQVNRA